MKGYLYMQLKRWTYLHPAKETYNCLNENMYGKIDEQQCNQTFENVFRRVYVRTNVTTYEHPIVSMIISITP